MDSDPAMSGERSCAPFERTSAPCTTSDVTSWPQSGPARRLGTTELGGAQWLLARPQHYLPPNSLSRFTGLPTRQIGAPPLHSQRSTSFEDDGAPTCLAPIEAVGRDHQQKLPSRAADKSKPTRSEQIFGCLNIPAA